MSKIKIIIERSEQWVREQRLATGQNIPQRITAEVDPAELSIPARVLLLGQSWSGEYRDIDGWGFNKQYQWASGCYFGTVRPVIDADEPTAEQIDAAIRLMDDALLAKRAEADALEAEREKEAAERKRAEAEKAAKTAEARELLAEELESSANRYRRLGADLDLLADFLSFVPQDAKRCALKSLAADRAEADAETIKQRIEDANPYRTSVFDDDE